MSLTGDSINITTSGIGGGVGLTGIVVGNGLEVDDSIDGGAFDIDVQGDSVIITQTVPLPRIFAATNITLSDLDWVNDPNGFISDIDVSGFVFSESFTDDSITVGFLNPGEGNSVTIDITTECFLPGTRILTDRGEINVEDLSMGDLVKTADGFQPIKWIGKQTVDPTRVKSALRSYPICVKAGALGDNLPQRDLYLSPDHALLVEELLINAGALVNGTSIIKTEPTETFTYYHVELDIHALMVVEGTYAESYLPQKEDRHCYDNSDEFDALYPNQCTMILWPLDYPRSSSYTTVPRYIRKRLNAIADEQLNTQLATNNVLQLA